MKIQKLNNSKLFYKKWPYRVECVQSGARSALYYKSNDRNIQSESPILDLFIQRVRPYLTNKNLQIRIEQSHFNIFCADYNLLEDINRDLGSWIVKISGPTTQEEYDFLMCNGHRKILCDKLPHDKFKYKIIFDNIVPQEIRENFYKWLDNYKDKINMGSRTRCWLSNQKKYIYYPGYMYVIDDKTTSMISLYAGNNIKSIIEYVPRDMVVKV